MAVLGTGQYTITDLHDAIISGEPPSNPREGALWIDNSQTPSVLYRWDGAQWTEQNLSLEGLDPDASGNLNNATMTLASLSADNIISKIERGYVKDKVTDIVGIILADTASMPTLTAIDGGSAGEAYSVRTEAINAGLATDHASYVAVGNEYTNLANYLNAMTPKPWDTTSTADISITVSDWRDKWLKYYTAVLNLRQVIADKLKEAVDNIIVQGVNLIPNSIGILGDWVGGATTTTVDSRQGLVVTTTTSGERTSSSTINGAVQRFTVEPNTNYTVSVWIETSANCKGADVFFLSRVPNSTASVGYDYVNLPIGNKTSTAGLTQYTGTFMTKANEVEGYIRIDNNGSTDGLAASAYFCELKMEKGILVTDWTECPDDDKERIRQTAASIRDDLNLTSPLPTSIIQNADGITAMSPSDPNVFARLDYRGLYVQGGALVIDGGLASTQLSAAVNADIATGVTAKNNADTDNGVNKWVRRMYNMTTAAGIIPDYSYILAKSPNNEVLVNDSTSLASALSDNYIGVLKTAVYVSAAKNITFTFTHDDGCQIYVNGKSQYTNGLYTQNVSATLNLNMGWNTIEILWAEHTGGDGIYNLNTTISSLVDKMSCFYAGDMGQIINVEGLAGNSVQQNTAYNGVKIDSTNGIKVTSTKNILTMNATNGLLLQKSDLTNIFSLDANGNLVLTGNLTATAGTIDGSLANITNVNASNITTGTLSASRIAANTITSDKILVGDFGNYVDDPTFANSLPSGSWSIDTTTVRVAGGKSLKLSATTVDYTTYGLAKSKIPVKAGDQFYCEFWAYRDNATQVITLNLEVQGPDGTYDYDNDNRPTTSISQTNGTWQKYSSIATVTKDGMAAVQFKLPTTGDMTGNWYFSDVIVRRAVDAQVIVDGSVTANKMNTKGLTVNNGTKNTLVIDSAGNVTMDGTITSNNATITGGTLTVGTKFSVLNDGTLSASSATISGNITATSGNIAGFTVTGSQLYTSTKSTLASTTAGVYVGTDGIALGAGTFKVDSTGALTATSATITGTVTSNNATITGGSLTVGQNFAVTNTGVLTASGATISGAITATSGNVAGFTIAGSQLYTGTKSTFNSTNTGVYVGTDGIALGNGNFKVDSSGNVTATNATVSGAITATSGAIASFNIAATQMYTGTKSTFASTTAGVYVGADGISLGTGNFKVDSNGNLTASTATITGTITSNNATITAGSIGGFVLAGSQFYTTGKSTFASTTAGVYLGTDGIALGTGNFKVDSNGNLTASTVNISGTISSNNATITAGNIGGFIIAGSQLYTTGKSTLASTTSGVYLGTDGIALGTGNFKVDSSGNVNATSANITGVLKMNAGSTLDASYINAGILDANRIGAKTITASKLAVVDDTNYSLEQSSANPQGLLPTWTDTSVTPNKPYYLINTRDNHLVSSSVGVPMVVKNNDEFVFTVRAKAYDATTTLPLNAYIFVRYSDGTIGYPNVKLLDATTTLTTAMATVKVIVDGTKVVTGFSPVLQINKASNQTTSENWLVETVDVRKKTGGELIVDGAITASKIAANTITLTHLNNGIGQINGIATGGAYSGNIRINRNYQGNANPGEIHIVFGTYTHPNGTSWEHPAGVNDGEVSTPMEGTDNTTLEAYVAFIGSDASRVTNTARKDSMFAVIRWTGTAWQYTDNSTWLAFTPNANDALVAKLTRKGNDPLGISSVAYYADMAIIDGDKITIGTIDANNVTVDNINAANIRSGYLSAGRIYSASITADKLSITDYTNYAAGSHFDDDNQNPWILNASHIVDTSDKHSGTKSLKLAATSSAVSSMLNKKPRANAGEQFYIEMWIKTTADFNGTVGNSKIRIGDAGNASALIGGLLFGGTTYPAWTKVSTSVTIPNTTDVDVSIVSDNTVGTAWIDDIRIIRKNAGELIVDGAITANKLSVTQLSAISADMGSVTAGSMNIGSGKFTVASDGTMTATGATISGTLTSTAGTIGGFTLGSTYIRNGKTSYNETTNDGVYVGTDGIGLGKGKFYVTSAGALTATSATITGTLTLGTGSTVDASYVTSGTLPTARIGVGSIDATKLVISDFTNLAENPAFEDGTLTGWSYNSNNTRVKDITTVTGITGDSSKYSMELDALSTGNNDAYATNIFPVTPGQQFIVTGTGAFLNTAGTGTFRLGFRRYDSKKVGLSNWDSVANWSTKSQTFTDVSGVYTVPAGCYFLDIWASFANNGETTNKFYLDNVRVHRAANAELIVDGSIIAGKIATDAVTSAKIQAGAITSDKVSANQITASHITIGDYTNLVTVNENISTTMLPSTFTYGGTVVNTGYVAKVSTGNQFLMLTDFMANSFRQNDEVYFEFEAYAAAAGNVTLSIWGYNASKSNIGSNATTNFALTTTSTKYSGSFKLSHTGFNTAIYYLIGFNASSVDIRVKNVIVRKKHAGNMLVDGSIVLGHLGNGLGNINGVPTGGAYSGTFKLNQSYNGNANDGEIRVIGGVFSHPDGTTYTVPDALEMSTQMEGTNTETEAYIMFMGSNNTRFTGRPANNSSHFIVVKYSSGAWYYDNNTSWVTFTPVAGDCIIAKVTKVSGSGGFTGISYYTTMTIIDGDNIRTGNIDASVATITNINATNISTGTLNSSLIAAGSITSGHLAVVSPNLIPNGWDNFEQLSSVTSGSAGNGGTAALSTDYAYVGTKSLKFTNTTTASSYKYLGDTNKIASATAGKRYLLSGYVMTTSATAHDVQLCIVYRDSANGTTGTFTATKNIKASDGWVRITAYRTADANTASVTGYIRIPDAVAYTTYWDAFQIECAETNLSETQASPFRISGTTDINGDNITTGTIDASKVQVTNIDASKIVAGTITSDKMAFTKTYNILPFFDTLERAKYWNNRSYGIATPTGMIMMDSSQGTDYYDDSYYDRSGGLISAFIKPQFSTYYRYTLTDFADETTIYGSLAQANGHQIKLSSLGATLTAGQSIIFSARMWDSKAQSKGKLSIQFLNIVSSASITTSTEVIGTELLPTSSGVIPYVQATVPTGTWTHIRLGLYLAKVADANTPQVEIDQMMLEVADAGQTTPKAWTLAKSYATAFSQTRITTSALVSESMDTVTISTGRVGANHPSISRPFDGIIFGDGIGLSPTYGLDTVITAAGATIIGGGESATVAYNQYQTVWDGDKNWTEDLILTSDYRVRIMTGMSDSTSRVSKVAAIFETDHVDFFKPLYMNNQAVRQAHAFYFNDSSTGYEGFNFLKTGATSDSQTDTDYDNFRILDGVTYLNDNPMFSGSGHIFMNNKALIASSGTGTDFTQATVEASTNIDHLWHDDTNNAWNFVSDGAYHGVGNSTLNAGNFKMASAGGRIYSTYNGTDYELLRDYNNGNVTLSSTGGYLYLGYANTSIVRVSTDLDMINHNITNLGSIVNEDVIAPTLLNSWVNYGSGYRNAGYWKDKNGVVHLTGMIKSGTLAVAAFTLPVGYRPSARLIFTTMSNNVTGRVDVYTDGSVDPLAPSSNAWVSLDGISFKAEA